MNVTPPQTPVYETHFPSGKIDTRLVVPSYGADDGVWHYEILIPKSMVGQQLTFLIGDEITHGTTPHVLAKTAQLARKVHDDVVNMCRAEYNQDILLQNINRYIGTIIP